MSDKLKVKLDVWKYPTEGYLQQTYSPLRVLLNNENKITDFNIAAKDLGIASRNIVFECQPSYDGTVNLIFNDDVNPPRIINSRFSKKENDTFKVINRIQSKQTNLYNEHGVNSQTRLIKNVNTFPIIDLLSVSPGGQLKGGNYTFYLKYVDQDYNETPIVCESGQVSVFHGYVPREVSGSLSNEIVTKTIHLMISNLDTNYTSFNLYYIRNYSGMNGERMIEAGKFVEPFVFSNDITTISITGYESTEDVSLESINIRYQSIDSAKTQTQSQNLLFFGNIEKTHLQESELQNCSYFIKVTLKQDASVGYVSNGYLSTAGSEYYDPNNIYYRLGYWPGEYYRIGVVYILNDDSLTPAFNLRGAVFNNIGDCNIGKNDIFKNGDKYTRVESNAWLNKSKQLYNTFGVFKNPDIPVIGTSEVNPLYYQMEIPEDVKTRLKELNVKGFFFVRQKRIPTILGQGVSFGIDVPSYSPMIPVSDKSYLSEGFLTSSKKEGLGEGLTCLKSRKEFEPIYSDMVQSSCLISLEANVSPDLQSTLNGESFTLEKISSGNITNENRNFFYFKNKDEFGGKYTRLPAIYVSEGTPYKFVGDYGFSTKFGTAEDVKTMSFFGKPITNNWTIDQGLSENDSNSEHETVYKNSDAVYGGQNKNILRGIYTGIIGICGNIENSACYNIRIPDYDQSKNEQYFTIRKNDISPFYSISNRTLLEDSSVINVYRGDCYSNTVTIRLNRNFVDPEVPIQDTVVDPLNWAKHYGGYLLMGSGLGDETLDSTWGENKKVSGDWGQINRSDLNAVPLGMWFTYKCLSSDNLGIRCIDRSYVDEQALLGSTRGFYPLNGINLFSSGKVADSSLINKGYGSTVGSEAHLPYKELPYTKELFDNRIAFSNIQSEDEFQNGYRVFQNLAYKDIDRQYGAIVKLLPWDSDLFCVFEHGIGIIPVNQKALMSTTTGQSIHLYGSGVLQKQVSVISDSYGSVWQESIIKTPLGIYGIDTFAKKIWRYTKQKGFETISDMVVQRFLNDNILLEENLSSPLHCVRNVKSHYNEYKGDVMFTFYNYSKNVEWNLCYNERLGKWITRYSWTPVYSENINNIFYSFDKRRSEVLGQIAQLNSDDYGMKMIDSDSGKIGCIYTNGGILNNELYQTNLVLNEHSFIPRLISGETSYLDKNNKEVYINISDSDLREFITVNDVPLKVGFLSFNADSFKVWWKKIFNPNITETEESFSYLYKDNSDEKISIEEAPTASIALQLAGIYDIPEDALSVKDGFWGTIEIGEVIVSQSNTPTEIPLWLRINIDTDVYYNINRNDENAKSSVSRSYTVCFLVDSSQLNDSDKQMYDEMFINGVYVHGRAGIFDEIDYTDESLNNQILPTKWYDKQEPFEFEFVINDPIGLHKIFENLTIISNNVAPESIQFEIEGDAYSMWKTMGSKDINPTYDKNLKKRQYKNNTLFKNASVKWDTILNQYSILMSQECKSIEKFGRRLGNMHYKEDSWYITIDPLLLNKNGKTTSTKLRDKYLKVRVRYSGEDLAVITAIKSMVNLSAS